MQEKDISHEVSTKSQKQSSQNLDLELSKLTKEDSSYIKSSMYNGGRSFHAIWSLDIKPVQKVVLSYLGSKINFTKVLTHSFESVSLSEIVIQTGYSTSAVKSALKALRLDGYIEKRTPNISICITNHVACSYCLTTKLFDEFGLKLIEWNKLTHADTKQRKGFYSFLHPSTKYTAPNKKKKSFSVLDVLGQNLEPMVSEVQGEKANSIQIQERPRSLNAQALRLQETKGLVLESPSPWAPEDNIFLIGPNNFQIIPVCENSSEIEKPLNSECTKITHIEKKREEQEPEEINKEISKSTFQNENTPELGASLDMVKRKDKDIDKDIRHDGDEDEEDDLDFDDDDNEYISTIEDEDIIYNKDSVCAQSPVSNNIGSVQSILAKRYEENLSKSNSMKNLGQNLGVERLGVSETNNPHKTMNFANQGKINNSSVNEISTLTFQNKFKTLPQSNFSEKKQDGKKKVNFEKNLSEISKKLKDTACLVFNRKIFIPFSDCEKAILAAMAQTSATLEDITVAIEDKAKYNIFSGQSINSMTNDLVKWIHGKDEIIAQYEKEKSKYENTIEDSVRLKDENSSPQVQLFERTAILNNQNNQDNKNINNQKERVQFMVNNSPQFYQNYYNEVRNRVQKNALDKDLSSMTEQQFKAYIDSFMYRNKSVYQENIFI